MSHINESCPTWMSHVPYEWSTSFKGVGCERMWMSHVPCEGVMSLINESHEWVMPYMNKSSPIWMRHVPYEWIMSHMNESCHIWMSQALYEINHVPYEWFMSYMNELFLIWMSHFHNAWVMSHMNESCHIWMSHVTYERVMSHTNASYHNAPYMFCFLVLYWFFLCSNCSNVTCINCSHVTV